MIAETLFYEFLTYVVLGLNQLNARCNERTLGGGLS